MARAIVMRTTGGPDVLRVEDVDVPAPGAGEVQLRQTAAGVNFHDVYVRSGLYQTLTLPGTPGIEAVGVVEAVGPGVTTVRAGDRVGYLTHGYGGYAEARVIDAGLLIPLPAWLDDRAAAATLLRGLTVEMLVRHVHPVRPGEIVLVHAAAGGVGRLLCQWSRHLGATVIGTVGSDAKAAQAQANGCDHVIRYRAEDFVSRVEAITGGRGVDVAYDSVGRDTVPGSLACLARFGHLVNYGQASGPVDPLPMPLLFRKSNRVTRPSVFHYLADRGAAMAASLFEALRTGVISPGAWHAYPLQDAGRAHEDLETRATSGSVLLTI